MLQKDECARPTEVSDKNQVSLVQAASNLAESMELQKLSAEGNLISSYLSTGAPSSA
jgi:hypothetical protein